MLGNIQVGWIGELHPRWQRQYELPAAPVLYLNSILAAGALSPAPGPYAIVFDSATRAGAGAFGEKHLDGLKNIDGVEIVSIISRTAEQAAAVAAGAVPGFGKLSLNTPQTLERLAAVTGAIQETLETVMAPFRLPGASFLRPYGSGKLTGDTGWDRAWSAFTLYKDENNPILQEFALHGIEHGLDRDARVRACKHRGHRTLLPHDSGSVASVLPPDVPVLAVEAGVSLGWERYVTPDNVRRYVIPATTLGASTSRNRPGKAGSP